MLKVLLALCVLTSPALAKGWTPVDAATAKAFLVKIQASIPEADRVAAKVWPKIAPLLADGGLLYGVDTIGLDDDSTAVKSQRWLPDGKAAQYAICLPFLLADEAQCSATDCSIAASHFASHVALRRDPAGQIRIVGAFDTNSLVEGPRAQQIDTSHKAWLSALEGRYGKDGSALPPVSLGPPVPGADKHNSAGLKHLRGKQHAKAIARFEQAVRLDPSHLLARCNLACALSLARRFPASRAVLRQFKAAPDCPGCQVRLVRARTDADFTAQRADPDFKAIVADAKLPVVTPEAAAKAVNALFNGKPTGVAPYIDSRGKIAVKISGSVSEKVENRTVRGHALTATITGMAGTADDPVNLEGMTQMVCSGVCCHDTDDALLHNTIFLDKVCVKTDTAGWTTLDRIEVTDGD